MMRHINTITKNLLIINIIVFMACLVVEKYGYGSVTDVLSLHFILAKDFHFWQFFTYQFLHADAFHLFSNMFALWMFGSSIESVFGSRRFLFYYLVCGIGAGITQEIWQLGDYFFNQLYLYDYAMLPTGAIPMTEMLNRWSTIGASGAVYGILLAFGMLFPNHKILLLLPPIPIKAKYFVIGYAIFELLNAITGSGGNIAHFAHLGGMLFGYFLIRYWQKKNGSSGNGTRKTLAEQYRYFMKRVQSLFVKRKMKVGSLNAFKIYKSSLKDKERLEDINPILTKLKQNGYESLTTEEKQKLFEHSKPN